MLEALSEPIDLELKLHSPDTKEIGGMQDDTL